MHPRLVTISLVRNEVDIIETFVRHNAAYATKMIFILHRCIDNTEEILQKLQTEGLPLEIHEETHPGYLQSDVLTGHIRRILAEDTADWILPLDADEFLTAAEGGSVMDGIAAFGTDRVQMLSWKTYVPLPEDDMSESNPIRRITRRRMPETAPVRKVLLPVPLLKTASWKLPMGCHTLQNASTGDALPSIATAAISLAHFPVRSIEQFTGKILGGWTALAATAGCDPQRVYHWHTLAQRVSSGAPISINELRNIALRYATPEGASALPTLVLDAVTTTTGRPLHAIYPATAMAVVLDAALACAQIVGREEKMQSTKDLHSIVEKLHKQMHGLARALREHKNMPELKTIAAENTESDALACVIAMLAGVLRAKDPLTGSSLSRRQQLAHHVPALPAPLEWIAAVLSLDKLPHTLERAIQDVLSTIAAGDRMSLGKACRAQSASDDILLMLSQHLTASVRASVPLPLAASIAQSLHHLLTKEARIDAGLCDERIRMIDPACARGEIACELLRCSAHASMQYGMNPDNLRKDLLQRILLRDRSQEMIGVTCVRVAATFADMGMPLRQNDEILIGSNGALEVPQLRTVIPVVGTALVSGGDAFYPDEETTAGIEHYLRDIRRTKMDQDAGRSPVLRSLVRIRTILQSADTGAGGIVIPRSFLHYARYATLRRDLLEQFEQIWILDLGGEKSIDATDDEPIDGSDDSGTAILLLLRAPRAPQGVHYAYWRGLKIQKYHALLSRAFTDMPWQRIVPEKPGYVFLP